MAESGQGCTMIEIVGEWKKADLAFENHTDRKTPMVVPSSSIQTTGEGALNGLGDHLLCSRC